MQYILPQLSNIVFYFNSLIGSSGMTDYIGAPEDETAWIEGNSTFRILRGGSWLYSSMYLSSSYRYFNLPEGRNSEIGFRIAQDL